MFILIILSSLFARTINGCGFVEYLNGTYFPLNACVIYRNFDSSFSFSCYANQLHMVDYYTSDCTGAILSNLSISRYNYECDNPQTCDSIQYGIYPADVGGMDCSTIGDAPYSFPSVINYCHYDRNHHLYKMHTCTDTVWSTFYYTDALCSGSPYTSQIIDHCDHGSSNTYIDIQTCTTPMNHVADQCGYVQYRKGNRIEPLNACIETDSFSYIWTCHSSKPFLYFWNDNQCGDFATMDGNISVVPIAYSCARNPCNQSFVTTYQTDNCTDVASDTTRTTLAFITDTCMNWFNANNSMASEQYFCIEDEDQTTFYGVSYDKPNCDDSEGSRVFVNYTDRCVESQDNQYVIECSNVLPHTTAIPIVTTSTSIPVIATTSSTTAAIPSFTTRIPSTPAPTSKNERVLYVSSTGEGSCLHGSPCGTLQNAIHAASFMSRYDNISKVEIIVQGQNEEEIRNSVAELGINPCIPQTFFEATVYFKEIIITFDTDYVHEMKDWYNTHLCESGGHSSGFFSQSGPMPFSLIINHMRFDSYTFEGRSHQPFYIVNMHQFTCNHCAFRNLTIRSDHHSLDELYKYTDDGQYPTLISSSVMQLNQCEFENIAYELSSDNVYRFSLIQIHGVTTLNYEATFSLAMTNRTLVTNITHLYRFIDVYMYSAGSAIPNGDIVVNDVTFNDITVFDAIMYHYGHISGVNSNVRITNTNVYHLTLGSIFRVVENTKSFIQISNMNISTPQTIQHTLSTKQSHGITLDDYYSLFVFESKYDIIRIESVNVEYIYGYYLTDNCQSESIWDWYFRWLMVERTIGKELDFVYTTMECNVPIEFMHSVSDVDIQHLTVRNDITDILVKAYKSFIVDEIHSFPGSTKDTVYIQLVFDFDESTAFIYNDGGTLNVDYLTVFGMGAHETIIHNPNGDLSVHQMTAVPDTYCTLIPCEYDRDSIQIATWIRFAGGESKCSATTLTVSDSYIYGSELQAIVVGAGYAYLHNVTITMAALGIYTDTDCIYVEMIECNLLNIGAYYASSTAFLTAYSDIRVPFVLLPSELVIRDSVFSYVGPYQFVMFGTAYYWKVLTESDRSQRKITLINNIFEINDRNVVTPYLTNHTLQYLDEIDMVRAWNNENYTVDVDHIDASKHFLVNGTMYIESDMDVMMLHNEFRLNPNNLYLSPSVLADYNLPWIYATNNDSGVNSICMSGNEFSGFAIYAHHANITSCVKTQLLEYFTMKDCDLYGTFGTVSSSAHLLSHQTPNVFNIDDHGATSILRAEYDSFIALDNNVINILHSVNEITTILDIFEGNYLLIDTIINTTTAYDIKVNEHCDIRCYSIVSNDANSISVFHAMCGSDTSELHNDTVSIHEIYDVYPSSHWSPYLIRIDPHNNGSYVPGNKLLFNYSIHDIYDNVIDSVHQELVIAFQPVNSSELAASFQLVIDDTGFCAECVHGISFPAFTLDAVDDVYSFSGLVTNNNVRIEEVVNVTVDRCPSGFGATGTNQCDLCSIGYFNLVPTDDGCYYCNENAVDGITCPGSNHIMIDYNYWVSVYAHDDADDDSFASKYVVSSKCPSSYCCQRSEGCDLLSDSASLCASKRDFNTYLCGSCVAGYSEAVGTAKCMKCNRDYPLRLLIPISYGFLWAMFILFTKRSPKANPEQDPKSKPNDKCCCFKIKNDNTNSTDTLTRDEYLDCLQIMMSKIILYYYQSVAYILTTSGIQSTLYGFVELSNLNVFQFIGNTADRDGYCIFQNMTAPQKISLQLIATASILFFIFIAYLCSLCCCTRNAKRGLRIHFPQCFIAAMLICVGQVLSVLFQLLACRQITSDIAVHFFFGEYKCYEWIWISCIVSLVIVFLSFFILFLAICIQRKKQKPEQDSLESAYYYPVSWSYSDSYWYWESILFVRRSVFAFVFIVFDNNNLKVSIGILLFIYLYIHGFAHPFKAKDANRLEGYLIGITALIIFIDASSSDKEFQNVTISLLILFPLVWFIYFMLSRCNSLLNTKSAYAYNNAAMGENDGRTVELYGDTLKIMNALQNGHHAVHAADSSHELEP